MVGRIYAGERDRDVLLRQLSQGGYRGCGRRGGVLDLRSLVVHVLELLASGDVAALKAWSKQDKSVVRMVWNTPNYQLFFDKNALTFRRMVQVPQFTCFTSTKVLVLTFCPHITALRVELRREIHERASVSRRDIYYYVYIVICTVYSST